MVVYLDSSALVKLVRTEPESNQLTVWLTEHSAERIASALARVEVLRAVAPAGPAALARARRVLRLVELIPLYREILDKAALLAPPSLRSLDAIHLATALIPEEQLSFVVTYDERMVEAARALGLTVAAPGQA